MSGLFERISNEVLEATEMIAARWEEGVSILLGEDTTGQDGASSDGGTPGAGSGQQVDLEDLDLDDLSDEEIQQLLHEHMDQSSPLEGIADSVMSDIMSRQSGPTGPLEHFHAFRSAITWSEKFILGLIGFQIFMFLLCYFVSRRSKALAPRLVVMVFIGAVVRSAEWLNGLGARHWEKFATQNYFDRRGIFVAIMLSGPLLLDSFLMLISFVVEASQLLVTVKKEELRRKKQGTLDRKKKKKN